VTAYYNEKDKFAAAWLRELIRMGQIAPGVVDERSIEDIVPADLEGYTQCHFFAGIGVWSYALRRAGWPDDRPVWTGSCPCQPFSAAGKAGGFTDERHLWPHWIHLIQYGKPKAVPVLGEQVASKDGLGWLDLVQTDMEGAGYACGAVDLCAAGVGAPHIRQRLFFVAEWLGDSKREGLEGQRGGYNAAQGHGERALRPVTEAGEFGGMADTMPAGRAEGWAGAGDGPIAGCGEPGGVADTDRESTRRDSRSACGPQTGDGAKNSDDNRPTDDGGDGRPGPTNGLWADADWLYCRDGKWRPVEPGTFPLVDGTAEKLVRGSDPGVDSDVAQTAKARTGRLKGYGNAINAEVATAFIEAYMTKGYDAA